MRPDRDDIAIPPFPPGTTWIGAEEPVSERMTARSALLVHFFELGELSGIRTLPFVAGLARTYAENGLSVLGVPVFEARPGGPPRIAGVLALAAASARFDAIGEDDVSDTVRIDIAGGAELDVAARNRAGAGPLRGDRIEPGHEELERRVNGAGLGREKAPAAAVRRGEEQLRPGKPYPVEHGGAVFLLDAEDVVAPLIGVGRTQRCDQHECDCHDQRQPSNCTVHHALSAPVPL